MKNVKGLVKFEFVCNVLLTKLLVLVASCGCQLQPLMLITLATLVASTAQFPVLKLCVVLRSLTVLVMMSRQFFGRGGV